MHNALRWSHPGWAYRRRKGQAPSIRIAAGISIVQTMISLPTGKLPSSGRTPPPSRRLPISSAAWVGSARPTPTTVGESVAVPGVLFGGATPMSGQDRAPRWTRRVRHPRSSSDSESPALITECSTAMGESMALILSSIRCRRRSSQCRFCATRLGFSPCVCMPFVHKAIACWIWPSANWERGFRGFRKTSVPAQTAALNTWC